MIALDGELPCLAGFVMASVPQAITEEAGLSAFGM